MLDFITTTLTAEAFLWFKDHGPTILAILVVAFIVQKFGHLLIERAVRRLIVAGNTSREAEEKRENTLIRILNGALIVVLWIVVLLTILQESGIAVGPILAAAGIAGVAIGFGGQYLIRDLVTGLFIVMENQYRVGDVACFDGTCGLVEAITLRMTTLRDLDGTVHHVPHGEIKKVSNLTKGFSRVNLNIGISYSCNLEHVIEVINRVGNELAADPAWKESITAPPQFLRIDDFADSAIIIKILGDTKPIEQWDVTGELRKRLKIAFDQEGIEIPLPQRVIHAAHNLSKE